MYTAYRTTYGNREHLKLFFGSLFDLLAVLNLVNKDLRRFETRYKMFLYHKGSVTRNVPCYLPLALFIDKTSETPYIYVVAVSHGIFYHAKERFNRRRHVSLVHPGLFSDFVDYICFSHFVYF